VLKLRDGAEVFDGARRALERTLGVLGTRADDPRAQTARLRDEALRHLFHAQALPSRATVALSRAWPVLEIEAT
jgi:hypothetical protein